MGPVTRCLGNEIPPAQDWQNPLPAPPPPSSLPDFSAVKSAIRNITPPEGYGYEFPARLIRLAYQCASTFRVTDYLGGCNGARIRFTPQKDWPENVALETVLSLLQPIKDSFKNLSWADLIVLAGNTALESAGALNVTLPFCGGRTDAVTGSMVDVHLAPRITGDWG